MPDDAPPAREHDSIEGLAAPEQTRELIGHAEARAAVINAFAAGRLHHGWLLSGPRGIGKATLSFDLAREILTATGDEPAERVASQVANGAHPNLRVVRRRRNDKTGKFYSEIVIDDVRELIGYFQHTAGRAGTRVAILDAVEEMSSGAVNALLKTLEEPPPAGLLLLVSHRPGLLPATIRSRCRALGLRPLSDEGVRTVVAAAGIEATPDSLTQAVRVAAGRPRRALEALALGEAGALGALADWLDTSENRAGAAHLAIAGDLGRPAAGGAFTVALDMLDAFIVGRARTLAAAGAAGSAPLAMVSELWEKAHSLAAEQAVYNLDRRQTLVRILDLIRDLDETR